MSSSTAPKGYTTIAPAGWYPDPIGSGKMRWWDGRSWTSRLEHPGPRAQPAYGYSVDGIVTRVVDY